MVEWKECKLCNSYLVSNEGDVKHKKTNKILQQKLRKDNYLEVSISMGSRGNIKHPAVHRLVAEAFVPNPENKPLVRHIDGNTINNFDYNLEWVTSKEKTAYMIESGVDMNKKGEDALGAKLTTGQIQYCRLMYKPKDKMYGCTALARRFGVSKSTMSYIINNKTYI